jgi:hypothetical protein
MRSHRERRKFVGVLYQGTASAVPESFAESRFLCTPQARRLWPQRLRSAKSEGGANGLRHG